MKIVIIDYDVGNIYNIEKALTFLGHSPILSRNPKEVLSADKIILPGVGAFGYGITKLKEYSLDTAIVEFAKTGKDVLGVCLGMQLLYESSEEHGNWKGLGLLAGAIKKFPNEPGCKIPHMGWNKVAINKKNLSSKDLESYYYFVHSYYAPVTDDTIMTSHYAGINFTAAVKKKNITAFQFHPERSSTVGLDLLSSFIKN